jgi:hypothetical protein
MRFVCGLLFLGVAPLFAQFSGRITGAVVDSSGASVPGAQVDLYLAGGQKPLLTTKTSSDGQYYFNSVRAADCRIHGIRQVHNTRFAGRRRARDVRAGDPAAGTLGELQRRAFSGPWLFNIDMSLTKNVKLTERENLVLRWEAFNAPNHPSFWAGDQNINSSARHFGTVAGVFSPRIMEFGAHLTF